MLCIRSGVIAELARQGVCLEQFSSNEHILFVCGNAGYFSIFHLMEGGEFNSVYWSYHCLMLFRLGCLLKTIHLTERLDDIKTVLDHTVLEAACIVD